MAPCAAVGARVGWFACDARAVRARSGRRAVRARVRSAPGGAPGPRADGDDDDVRGGGVDEDGDEARRLEAKKKEFWRVFWLTLDEQRGKAPFMKRRSASVAAAVDADVGAEDKNAKTTAMRDDVAAASDRSGDGFWARCTIGGLVLAILMGLSAYSLTHWPTVAYVATHPGVFIFNPTSVDAAARVDVVLEIIRRLAKPAVRFAATWCALRSSWRAMILLFGVSTIIPAVSFSM